MSRLTPTLGIRETAKNIKGFMKTNRSVMWDIFKPLAPWILGLTLFDVIVTLAVFPESENGFMLGQIITGYFYTAFVISWHRVAIHGPDNYVAMNPLKPQKHELVFMGVGILVFVVAAIAGALAGATAFISPVVFGVSLLSVFVLATYLGYKICFYFPAKAVNNSITFGESFALTKGYFWKLCCSYFLVALKYFFGIILYFIGIVAVMFAIGAMTGKEMEDSVLPLIMGFVLSIPILVYFYPIFYTIGVTALSNYYQHAIQNKT